jgi:hypothetical protein
MQIPPRILQYQKRKRISWKPDQIAYICSVGKRWNIEQQKANGIYSYQRSSVRYIHCSVYSKPIREHCKWQWGTTIIPFVRPSTLRSQGKVITELLISHPCQPRTWLAGGSSHYFSATVQWTRGLGRGKWARRENILLLHTAGIYVAYVYTSTLRL